MAIASRSMNQASVSKKNTVAVYSYRREGQGFFYKFLDEHSTFGIRPISRRTDIESLGVDLLVELEVCQLDCPLGEEGAVDGIDR